jgi:hypothetical protein
MQDGSELVTDLTATEGLVLQGVMGPAIRSIEEIGPESGSSVDNAYAAADRSAAPRLNFDGSDGVAEFLDDSISWSPLQDRSAQKAFYTAGIGSGSSAAAAAAAASASRNAYFKEENRKLDAERRDYAFGERGRSLDNQEAYDSASGSAKLADLAAQRIYNAQAAALDIKGATGQTAYNQSQLDRNLEGIGLGAMDYRRGESLAADPYRALEADQTGVASGQRRYAQDVRAAATASEEMKIALAERGVVAAKANEDRKLGVAVQGISSASRNADRVIASQEASTGLLTAAQEKANDLTRERLDFDREQATIAESLRKEKAALDAADPETPTVAAVVSSGTTSSLTSAQQWERDNPDKVTRTKGLYNQAERIAANNNAYAY